MLVKDLIKLLMKQNPDAPVVINMGRNEMANGCDAFSVEEENGYHYKDTPKFWHKDYFGLENIEEEDCFHGKVVNICGSRS
jgi:hypothetical protein